MNCLTTIITVTLLTLATSQARLGETVPELQARYGTPTSTDATARIATFEKQGITIRAHLDEHGRTDWLTFQQAEPLTIDQIKQLLTANANGQAWQDTTIPSVSRSPFGPAKVMPITKQTYKAPDRWAVYQVKERYLAIALKGVTVQPPGTLSGF